MKVTIKKENFSEMSTEALKKQMKLTVVVTSALAGMITVLLGLSIYISINDKITPLLAMPFTLSPIIILNWSTVNQIKKELKSRNELS